MSDELPASGSAGMAPARHFYFFFYAAAASLLPFLVIYYEQLGLSGAQIGVLTGLLPLVTLFSAPLWGGAADASNRHRTALTLAVSGVLLSVFALSRASTFLWLMAAVVGFALFVAPIMPLVDNTVMAALGRRKGAYGKQRLWGAVGWGLAAPLAGALSGRAGIGWLFYAYIGLMFVALLVGRRLPLEAATHSQPFWSGLRLLLGNRQLALFLATVFVGGAGLGLVSNYLFLYLSDLGASKTLMGLSLTAATVSEVPVLFFSARLLARWGARGLLAISLAALAIRVLAYSVMGAAWVVLLIQLLHGPSFAAMWSAGVHYADRLAPPGLGATAQALFTSVMIGLGSAAGGFSGGLLYDAVGPVAMFRLTGAMVFAALLVVLASNHLARRVAPIPNEAAR
jgi:MFS transporter, PPP family, 3-phenylpropionic acid transporter